MSVCEEGTAFLHFLHFFFFVSFKTLRLVQRPKLSLQFRYDLQTAESISAGEASIPGGRRRRYSSAQPQDMKEHLRLGHHQAHV